MRHIVSLSGGKDSTAMLLRMIELNMPIDKIVFCDTGLEFPEMYDYLKKLEKYIGRKITYIKGKNSWHDWFYGRFTRGKFKGRVRGFPYTTQPCWALRELKLSPWQQNGYDKDYIYLGIAADEDRKLRKQSNYKYPLRDWNWSEKDCLNYLKEKNILNPLYKKFKRLGCWCCPKQPHSALKIIYEDYPELWKKLKIMEKDSPHGFKIRRTLKELEEKWK